MVSQGVAHFDDFSSEGSGLEWKECFETFSCIVINRARIIEMIVISHVDVSSCGISLRRGLGPQSLT